MRLVLPVVVAAVLGCGGKKAPREPVGINPETAASTRSAAAKARPKADLPTSPATAYLLVTLGDKSVGPFATTRDGVGMAAYVGTGEEGARRIVSIPLGENFEPRGDAHVVVPVSQEVTALTVRPTRGKGAGFVAAWTSLTDRGEALSVAGMDDAGVSRGASTELARTTDDIVWFDVVPTAKGAMCVWAEETRGAAANILAVALEPDGRMRGVPVRVARGVLGWQAVATGDGVGLALVVTAGEPLSAKPTGPRAGSLSWLRLDTEARPARAPITVTTSPTVTGDVDVAHLGDRFLFAWTDRSGAEPEVTLASVGEDGAVKPPSRPLSAAGGSALVGFTAGPAGALLAWDSPHRRGRPTRRVQLAHIDPLGELDGRSTQVELFGKGVPELSPTATGFALAGVARDEAGRAVPTYLRLDANLTAVQTEPLLTDGTEEREPVQVAWGLTCAEDHCRVLSASGDRVRSIDLPARKTSFAPPLPPPLPSGAPQLGTVTTLAQGEPYADVAVASVDGGTLVALLTAALDDSAQKKRSSTAGASLTVRQLDAKGAPVRGVSTISTRALTIGGVAMAAGGKPEDGAAIAWVAREGGDPQVHVTRVDRRGRRQNDVQLTTTKGDAADVAIAWAGDGWVVAWVDWRAGNGEVYATKVGTDLKRVTREERITEAPGDASDVTLLARGDTVWLAWADPRESPADGFADVFVAPLRSKDAKRAAEEVRVLASAAHSRSPVLASTKEGLVVGWIEEAPAGADAKASQAHGAMLVRLDEQGHPRGGILKVRGAGDGFPTAMVLEGVGPAVRGVVARSGTETLDVDAIELLPRADAVRAFPLLTLDGPPSLDLSLALHDGALYYYDDGPEQGDRRARKATILVK